MSALTGSGQPRTKVTVRVDLPNGEVGEEDTYLEPGDSMEHAAYLLAGSIRGGLAGE